MKRTVIQTKVRPSTRTKIQEIAEQRGLTVSEFIRRAVVTEAPELTKIMAEDR